MFRKIMMGAIAAVLFNTIAFAQEEEKSEEGFQFTDQITLPNTSVKDQNRSGTCWSYSTLSFIESEMLRMGKPSVNLSEMFVVWQCYQAKAEKYVRMQGNMNFGSGGAFHDAFWVMKNFGLVPEEAYDGLTIGEKLPVHSEMDYLLKGYVDGVIKNKNKKLSPVWNLGFEALLDVYLGELPETFKYNGTTYTPRSFASDFIGINPDDYIEIGSYTHHPFYEKFIIELPDNWLWDEIYNVPLNELQEIADYALQNSYTVAWGADVSDKGFASKKVGVAVVPDADYTDMTDAEIAKWEDMEQSDKDKKLFKLENPGKEKEITQEMRQIDFDNYTSTDDHGMHIIGTATDQNGTTYYKVKNSWGDYNKYNGYFYLSKPYFQLRTIDIMVHKDAIPKHIKKKLGIK